MTTTMSERVAAPISTAELERRWLAVRTAMEESGIDALLMQNNNDHVGGYVKYFSDVVPVGNGYPLTIVFPVDGPMTMIDHGQLGAEAVIPVEGNGVLRGVGRLLTTASFAPAFYTREYDAMLACKALAPFRRGTIGLVGTSQMSYATVNAVKRELPDASYTEASDLVDRIKVIKSDEELECIRLAAAIQDAAMKAAFEAVEPGKRDSEIAALAEKVSQELGSEQGIYLCCSYAPGEPAHINHRHYQDRVMREGDVYSLLVENNGPGGFYAELGRTCVIGEAPEPLLETHEFTLAAQRYCVEQLQPGTPASSIWHAYNDFMAENGRAVETRLHCHGQGYDLVERPLIRHDEPGTIEANMNITCHPTYEWKGITSWICDNFIVGAGTEPEKIHSFDQAIVEL